LWESVVRICGWYAVWKADQLTPSARGAANKATAELRAVGAEPNDVLAFGRLWQRAYPDSTLRPMAVSGHWAEFLSGKLEQIAVERESREHKMRLRGRA
jgi:hypothetical protein